MSRTSTTRRERDATPLLGPSILVAVPLRTLADEYHDEPVEPVDSDRVPEPEVPGRLRRVMDGLARRFGRERRT
jgi:hypothetical protein